METINLEKLDKLSESIESIRCIYCSKPVVINDELDYHIECHNAINDFQGTDEQIAAKSMSNNYYYTNNNDLNVPEYIRQRDAQNRERELENNRQHNEQVRENRRQGAIQAQVTRLSNIEQDIVRISQIVSYQFIDYPKCIIFKSYDTIIGVLWNKHYYTIENNFSMTTQYHINTTIKFGSRSKIEETVSWSYYDSLDDVWRIDLNPKRRENATYNEKTQKWKVPYYNQSVTYLSHTSYPIREFERLLEKIGITHLQRYETANNRGYGSTNYMYEVYNKNINTCERGWNQNKFIGNLTDFIENNLSYKKNRYEFYIKYNSKDCEVKIWDMKLKKYAKFKRKYIYSDSKKTEYYLSEYIWKYGFKPIKKEILTVKGFYEKKKITDYT